MTAGQWAQFSTCNLVFTRVKTKAVGLAELISQGVDHPNCFREVATTREIEMDEDICRGCKGPGAVTFRHPAASLPGLPSKRVAELAK
jgi:hypothetical protein